MKENIQNIQTGLLVIIAATVLYGTFLQDNSPSRSQRSVRERNVQRQSNISATPPAQQNQVNNQLVKNQPQTPPPASKPVVNPTSIAFAEMSHNFGEIDQNSENTHIFKFTNTGDKPLIIETATGSCGCTVPEFPKEPIAPGATSEIKVVYKPGKQKGMQNKTVTVIANTQPRDTKLTISANVNEVN